MILLNDKTQVKHFQFKCCDVCPAEVEVGKDQEFLVNTKGAGGLGNVGVKITSPSGRPIPCKLESDKAKGTHSVKYSPPEEGQYKVDVSYDGNPVMGSPFGFEAMMPADSSKVKVHKVEQHIVHKVLVN